MFLAEVVQSKGHVSVQVLPPSMGDGNVREMTSTLISATMNPVQFMGTGAHGTAGAVVAEPATVVKCVATEHVTILDRRMEAEHVLDQTLKSRSATQPTALLMVSGVHGSPGVNVQHPVEVENGHVLDSVTIQHPATMAALAQETPPSYQDVIYSHVQVALRKPEEASLGTLMIWSLALPSSMPPSPAVPLEGELYRPPSLTYPGILALL